MECRGKKQKMSRYACTDEKIISEEILEITVQRYGLDSSNPW
jgi:hypothetical protein